MPDCAELDLFDFTEKENDACPDCGYSPTLRCRFCGRLTKRALAIEGALDPDPGYQIDPDDPFDDEDESEYIVIGNGYQIENEDAAEGPELNQSLPICADETDPLSSRPVLSLWFCKALDVESE